MHQGAQAKLHPHLRERNTLDILNQNGFHLPDKQLYPKVPFELDVKIMSYPET